jgi:uncharacterized protein (DUF433 family)
MTDEQRDLIVRHPAGRHRQAIAHGTRIVPGVLSPLERLTVGMSEVEIDDEHPTLIVEGVRAASAHGAEPA